MASNGPPYRQQRSSQERLGLVIQALNSDAPVVLAGSIVGWGASLEDSFRLIVFLVVETEIRLERIAAREMQRFGRVDPEFLAWAAQYEAGPREGRSLAKHQAWLASRHFPVIALKGTMTIEDQIAAVHDQAAEVAAKGSRVSASC